MSERFYRRLIVIISLSLPFFYLHAAKKNRLNTLPEYLREAILNNQELKSTFNEWKSAIEESSKIGSYPDPKFSYSYAVEPIETRNGPVTDVFQLEQTFPWFGRLSNREDVISEKAKALQKKLEAQKLKVIYEMTENFSDYFYLARARETTDRNIKLVTYFERVARTKYRAGKTPYSAIIKAQVELGKLEDQLKTILDMRDPQMARINSLMNRPTNARLPWPKKIPYRKVSFKAANLIEVLKENNPQLKSLDHLIQKEDMAIKLARKDYFPDLTIGVNYNNIGTSPFPTLDNGRNAWQLNFKINLPIWFGKNASAVEQSVKKKYSAKYYKQHIDNNLQADLASAIFNFKDAERKINLYRDTLIPKGQQSLKVTQQSFEAGKVNFLSLIDAQRLLLEFELLFEQSMANRNKYISKIEMLIGRPLLDK